VRPHPRQVMTHRHDGFGANQALGEPPARRGLDRTSGSVGPDVPALPDQGER
jgi:hypothetical protein